MVPDYSERVYPRGYTPSLVLEYVTPRNELRYGFSLVPTTPNGMKMNWSINQASSQTLEYSHNYTVEGNKGVFRVLSFYTSANMGNYDQSLALNPTSPSLIPSEKYGNIKYGFGINAEQAINKNVGVFFRTSWNDGNNESWAFTEIDRSISLGVLTKGNLWNRINDHAGLAYVASGLSIPHRNYLKASGMGFELGDGNLNYSFERLAEFYYSLKINKILYISTAYQHIIYPGYNKDRGAVNVFSVRAHVKI